MYKFFIIDTFFTRHYIAEISLNLILNHVKPKNNEGITGN